MQATLQYQDLKKIRERGCPNTPSHVVEFEATPKGVSRRQAIRLLIPFALASMMQSSSAKR
jgi:hypothetical protein